MYKLVLGVAALALSAGAASAQWVYPGYGYAGLYDYAAPGYYAGYGVPATAGTTVVIVTPGAPAYTAPTVVSPPLYAYAPGYWGGGYGWGGYGWRRAGYWWR
jgi:hypothetical protein